MQLHQRACSSGSLILCLSTSSLTSATRLSRSSTSLLLIQLFSLLPSATMQVRNHRKLYLQIELRKGWPFIWKFTGIILSYCCSLLNSSWSFVTGNSIVLYVWQPQYWSYLMFANAKKYEATSLLFFFSMNIGIKYGTKISNWKFLRDKWFLFH